MCSRTTNLIKYKKRKISQAQSSPRPRSPCGSVFHGAHPSATSRGAYDVRRAKVGLGSCDHIIAPKQFTAMIDEASAHMRLTNTVSLRQLRSSPFTSDKCDGRSGGTGRLRDRARAACRCRARCSPGRLRSGGRGHHGTAHDRCATSRGVPGGNRPPARAASSGGAFA